MMIKKKEIIEYRYYNMPSNEYILPLLGEEWKKHYGDMASRHILHFHNYYEIGYCYHGKGIIGFKNKEVRYSDNMFTLIPSNIPHTTISDEGSVCEWKFMYIKLDEFITAESQKFDIKKEDMLRVINTKHGVFLAEHYSSIADVIVKIMSECEDEELYLLEALKGYLQILVVEILRLDAREQLEHSENELDNSIKNAIIYINQYYDQRITIQDVAHSCGLSESHFRKLFGTSMNMKPIEYINLIRIQNACKIMKKKDLSMEVIASRVGYGYLSTFERNFKKIIGMTPQKWKNNYQINTDKSVNYKISAKKGWGMEEN